MKLTGYVSWTEAHHHLRRRVKIEPGRGKDGRATIDPVKHGSEKNTHGTLHERRPEPRGDHLEKPGSKSGGKTTKLGNNNPTLHKAHPLVDVLHATCGGALLKWWKLIEHIVGLLLLPTSLLVVVNLQSKHKHPLDPCRKHVRLLQAKA